MSCQESQNDSPNPFEMDVKKEGGTIGCAVEGDLLSIMGLEGNKPKGKGRDAIRFFCSGSPNKPFTYTLFTI